MSIDFAGENLDEKRALKKEKEEEERISSFKPQIEAGRMRHLIQSMDWVANDDEVQSKATYIADCAYQIQLIALRIAEHKEIRESKTVLTPENS